MKCSYNNSTENWSLDNIKNIKFCNTKMFLKFYGSWKKNLVFPSSNLSSNIQCFYVCFYTPLHEHARLQSVLFTQKSHTDSGFLSFRWSLRFEGIFLQRRTKFEFHTSLKILLLSENLKWNCSCSELPSPNDSRVPRICHKGPNGSQESWVPGLGPTLPLYYANNN